VINLPDTDFTPSALNAGGLKVNGVEVTATPAELNLLDGSVAGTAVASKALALGANKNVDVLAVADLKLGSGAGTSVTSTAAELNLLDGSVAGTAVASKALALGANKNVDVLAVADLKLGADAGTSVTATAAQLNASKVKFLSFQLEDLTADADIADRPLFVVPTGYVLTLTDVKVISQGSPAAIDDANTCVVVAKNGANAIVTKTYNTATAFPAAGAAESLGALDATHKVLAAGAVVKLSVTNGTSADPPAFILQLEGTLATA